MTGIDFEKTIVSFVCWKQMKGELYRGMSFLAMMLKNRSDSGWFESSIYNNALAFMRETDMKLDEFPDVRHPEFLNLLQTIDGIFAGTTPDRTGGALYVAHKSQTDTIAGERTAEIGQFIFFRSTE